MSIKVMSWVWDNSPYSGESLLIHLALADWSNDSGISWPTQVKMARKARCSTEHVRRVVKKMQQDGYVTIVSASRGPGSSHTYKLEYPTSSGESEEPETPRSNVIPHIRKDNTPHSPPNNRQEPSKPKCPYCTKPVTIGKSHDCPAMNQRIR